jgi:hypothetical protein
MVAGRRPRHWYYRVFWHPRVAAVPFAFFVYRVATAGFTTTRTIGLVVTTVGFLLAVLDRLPGHRLANWLDEDDR